MLRSFDQICQPADKRVLVAADDGHAALTGGGTYAMPWHWHDCLMFILPSHGAVELCHEDQRAGTWLSEDRFAVVPSGRAHQTRAGCATHTHLAVYVTGDALRKLDTKVGSLGLIPPAHAHTHPRASNLSHSRLTGPLAAQRSERLWQRSRSPGFVIGLADAVHRRDRHRQDDVGHLAA